MQATLPTAPVNRVPPDVVDEQWRAKRRMQALDLRVTELAEAMGVTQQHLSSVLNTGVRKLADPATAVAKVHEKLDEIEAEAAEVTT